MTDSNWLDDLDTLPDLRKKSKRKPKAPKAKGQKPHIRGETHPFVTLDQYNLKNQPWQRAFASDGILPIFRKYLPSKLNKAEYNPSHILGISPFWPEHTRINWSFS